MNTNETSTMTATLIAPHDRLGAWFTQLSADTRADITEMVNENGYPLHDIQEFVETYGEQAYCDGHYVTWCELTEDGHDNDAIEAYVDEVGIYNIGSFEDAFRGEYGSEAEFAEQWYTDIHDFEAPDGVVVDWQATWDTNLSYDFVYNSGYVFDSNV
jgi:Antirestriction protein (ArdA)